MSDENKFFRFVWRFNGVVIMLLLLGALVCGGVGIAHHHGLMHWRGHDARFAHFAGDFHAGKAAREYTLRWIDFGFMGEQGGERLYALDRYSVDKRDRLPVPFARNDELATVNILAVDEASKTSRWLFPHGERAILSETNLYAYDTNPKTNNPEAVVPGSASLALLVVESDSNKDGKLNGEDRPTLYFYRGTGEKPVKVLEADRIAVVPVTYGAKQFRLFYQKDGKSFAASYSLPQCKLESEIAVSGLPDLAKSGNPNLGVVVTD